MKISVFGSGYVGLVTAAGLADMGHRVLCIDIDPTRIESLRQGKIPFFEPGLGDLLHRNLRGGRIAFASGLDGVHSSSDAYFIAVGTPPMSDGRADTSAVFAVTDTIARESRRSALVAVKSTVPVGTCDAVQQRLDRDCPHPMSVVMNPEFLKEGAALEDWFHPDRVVIGVDHEDAERQMREMYRPLQLSRERVIVMSRRSAELTKYAANAMLATRISFMNELARLCDTIGADVGSVRVGIGSDRRIGSSFLYAGPGYGGSCFPKDVSALVHLGRDQKVVLSVCEATQTANELQRRYVLEKLLALFPEGMSGKTVAVWGLAFKPETDDVRDAPAGFVVRELLQRGAIVRAHDPEAAESFARAYAPGNPAVSYHDREYDCLDGADVLLLMTEWRHFRNPDFDDIRARMRGDAILDARNIWRVFKLGQRGWRYVAIGMR